MPAFNTSSGLPQPHFSVHDKNVATYRGSAGSSCLAEIGTLSMEFTAVSRLSGACAGVVCWCGVGLRGPAGVA